MIVSASYRTDVPAFWTPWFLARLEAGFARVRNPYGGADYEVSLRPGEVDAFLFWTRNAGPLLPHLERVREVAARDQGVIRIQTRRSGIRRPAPCG